MRRQSPGSMRRKIDALLDEIRIAQASVKPHPFLPAVEESLQAMKKNVRARKSDRESMAGALGRIVTDDYAFAESELGNHIFDVINEFAGWREAG